MIICPNCKTENIDSANFCLTCGKSLETVKNLPKISPDTKQCPYCAEEIKADAIVCRYCGRDLQEKPIEEKPRKSINILNPYLGCLGLLISGVLILFAITNPKKSAHTDKIYTTLGEVAGQQLAGNTGDILGSLFGKAVSTVADWYDVSLFEYHNYIVFSTTSFAGHKISVGYLSNVKIVAPVEQWINDFVSLTDIDLNDYSEPINQFNNFLGVPLNIYATATVISPNPWSPSPSLTPKPLSTSVEPTNTPFHPPTAAIFPKKPDEFIRSYYSLINNRDYEAAWSMLSQQFKDIYNNSGYQPYVDWWESIQNVTVISTEIISQNQNEALVNVELSYQYSKGQIDPYDLIQFNLVYDSGTTSWLINGQTLIKSQ